MTTSAPGRAALQLGGLAVIGVALLAGAHTLAAGRLQAQQRAAQAAALRVVLPAGLHDNDVAQDAVEVRAPHWLGSDAWLRIWRARRADAPSALVLDTVAPEGYAGPIRLRIAVRSDGRLAGAQVLAQRETAGLGDVLATPTHRWWTALAGRRLGDPPLAGWRVRRDGGEFDQLAGATQTPRAILHATRRVLQYVERHGEALFAAPAGARLEHTDAP